VEHHLYSDLDQHLLVRPATIDDAMQIAQLSTGDIALSEEALDAAVAIVAERLAVASGDDFFTIVAERKDNATVVGWLAAGGSRGQEHKGWSEIYAQATDASTGNTLIDEALLAVALPALTLAQFAGVMTTIDRDDDLRVELFDDLGFVAEVQPEGQDFDPERNHVRYSFSFLDG
jgi:hypothetical protein